MILISFCSCLCPIHWSQVWSWEWKCSWSSAYRRCSNYTWVINNFMAFWVQLILEVWPYGNAWQCSPFQFLKYKWRAWSRLCWRHEKLASRGCQWNVISEAASLWGIITKYMMSVVSVAVFVTQQIEQPSLSTNWSLPRHIRFKCALWIIEERESLVKCRNSPQWKLVSRLQWPLLLTWIDFNPSMDK